MPQHHLVDPAKERKPGKMKFPTVNMNAYKGTVAEELKKLGKDAVVGMLEDMMLIREFEFMIKRYLFTIWPVQLFSYASNLPMIGSQKMRENAQQLEKAIGRIDGMLGIFKFFMDGGWLYENYKMNPIIELLSPQERVEFECDVRDVEYDKMIRDYITGIAIWFLKEDKIAPNYELEQVVNLEKNLWDDYNMTFDH